uniref:Uncharacterized protein n=1 Tax=Opuntia streptacantha TaxID=393608 RepID=A0A7C9FR74_OPUST
MSYCISASETKPLGKNVLLQSRYFMNILAAFSTSRSRALKNLLNIKSSTTLEEGSRDSTQVRKRESFCCSTSSLTLQSPSPPLPLKLLLLSFTIPSLSCSSSASCFIIIISLSLYPEK